MVNIVKQNGYKKIYNSFNSGSWLAFHGIKVHIDNRCDPYMKEYSGTDYLTGQMMIEDIESMDKFVEKYGCDAIVLDLYPGTTDDWFADDLYAASDRYKVIYDNKITSTYNPDVNYRWMVVECIK